MAGSHGEGAGGGGDARARVSCSIGGGYRAAARSMSSHEAACAADTTSAQSPSPRPPMLTVRAARAHMASRVAGASPGPHSSVSEAAREIASTAVAKKTPSTGTRQRKKK